MYAVCPLWWSSVPEEIRGRGKHCVFVLVELGTGGGVFQCLRVLFLVLPLIFTIL